MLRRALLAAMMPALPSFAWAAPIGAAAAPDLHLIRIGAALLLGTFIAVVAALLLKRFRGARAMGGAGALPWSRRAGAGIVVRETRRLNAHADVCRFAYDGREYLVVLAAGGATLLRDTPITSVPESDA